MIVLLMVAWYIFIVNSGIFGVIAELSLLFSVEGDISKVLVKSLAEAHANTNPKLEYIHEMFSKPQDVSK